MYLRPSDFDAWSICNGRPALEESHAPSEAITLKAAEFPSEALVLQLVDLSVVTGERGAIARIDALMLADELHVYKWVTVAKDSDRFWSELKILAAAAVVKYALTHEFKGIVLHLTGAITDEIRLSLEELYLFAARVTEASSVALAVRGGSEALSHLTVGEQCVTCLARRECPQLAHELGKLA